MGYPGDMETTGRLTLRGVHAEDVPEVAALVARPGPFVSVYLDLPTGGGADTSRHFEGRWHALRQRLHADGAPDAILALVDPLVASAEPAWPAICVLADAEGAVAIAGPQPLGVDRVAFGNLPLLGPVVAWEQQTGVPRALVLIDRTGADIEVHPGGDGLREPTHEQVGDVDRAAATHVKPTGWSQRRYQQRAENRWRTNTGDVAARLVELTRALGLRQIVLAGDAQVSALCVEQMPADVASLVRTVSGSRAPGGDGTVADDVRRLTHTLVAEETVALSRRLDEELGQRDQAVNGPAGTIAALTTAAVATLLVHDDPDDERTVSISVEQPAMVALDPATVRGVVDGEVRPARLVDALVRAAWATGATVRVTPRLAVMEDGVAALLRFGRDAVPLIDAATGEVADRRGAVRRVGAP